MRVRFYTKPPRKVHWPHWILNMWNYKKEISQARRFGMEHLIVDSGVDKWFFVEKVKDYPRKYLDSYVHRARKITATYPDCFVTIPDYPDDYDPGSLWEGKKDNVERTFENIARFSGTKGINWIYVVQARFLDLEGFKASCKRMVREYDPERVGIGTACKTTNRRFIIRCMKVARHYFPDAWIHAFGPPMHVLPHIMTSIDSFDSMAYTVFKKIFNDGGKVKASKWLTNQKEKREAFARWVQRYKEITSKRLISDYF